MAISNACIIKIQPRTKDVWHWKNYCPKDNQTESSKFLDKLQSMTPDVIQEEKHFVASCYSVKNCIDMSEVR